MKNSEIRNIFYNYFEKHNHHKVLSAPLVPAKDPTLLFTNAGMNQFKSVFLNEEKREYQRAVSIQKCMRVSGKHNDFDEVGKSNFHHTFFEMLGNFSFGDYFKEKAIEFGWELLTQHYGFKPERLWVTVFREDDEAARIWEGKIGIPPHKIVRMDEKDNFWQMGDTGPCGPCSEIHFDRGPEYGPEPFSDSNKRYVEIWNLVFMQFFKDKNGTLHPLHAPSIDTGMGMERLTSLLQGVNSNYQTDLFRPLRENTAEMTGIDPDSAEQGQQIALNVIADHIRALTFLISDGVLPANDGRGYVLRRILRRAAKHGKSLGFDAPFLFKLSAGVIQLMKEFYPELEYHRDFVSQVLLAEEERFNNTLLNGLKRFEELLEKASSEETKIIPGEELFKLSDTYGFPLDFARDLAMEKDIPIDYKGFRDQLEMQREKSRLSLAAKQSAGKSLENIEKYSTTFTGYQNLEQEAVVLALYRDDQPVDVLEENSEGLLIVDKTPFYAESGGQVGDTGTGKNSLTFFKVLDTRKAPNGNAAANPFLHRVKVQKGTLRKGDGVNLIVDAGKRKNTSIHHSATHLLHAALREVLGLHVKQAGSYVGPDKLRFDFTHFKTLSKDELYEVESLINRKVRENIPIAIDTLKYENAIEQGAIAIFEEKYSDVVRVLSIGDFSKELCGGTHLDYTGEIGFLKITGDASISSGVRRIEAVAGEAGYAYIQDYLESFNEILTYFKQPAGSIARHLIGLDKKFKETEKQLKRLQTQEKSAKIDVGKMVSEAEKIENVPTVINFIEEMDRKQLSSLADEVKAKTDGISIFLTNTNGKSAIVVSIADSLTKKANAGAIARDIAGFLNGSGGGRPNFAQAGGQPVENFLNLKPKIADIITKYLNQK